MVIAISAAVLVLLVWLRRDRAKRRLALSGGILLVAAVSGAVFPLQGTTPIGSSIMMVSWGCSPP